MSDVFDVLKQDHETVEAMFGELENSPSALVTGGKDRVERAKLVERVIIEESKHEAMEEAFFWPAVRELVDGGDELADHAIEQESAGKKLLAELDSTKPDDPDFERLVREFIGDAREHVEYEETRVWPALRRIITAEDARRLGENISAGKAEAPTRPHPHTPPKPGVLKTAGKAAAKADRAWDRATGRGED